MKTLNEKIEAALKWAREAAENERGRCDAHGDDALVPSWLPELEDALDAVEKHEPTELELEMAQAAYECLPGPRY